MRQLHANHAVLRDSEVIQDSTIRDVNTGVTEVSRMSRLFGAEAYSAETAWWVRSGLVLCSHTGFSLSCATSQVDERLTHVWPVDSGASFESPRIYISYTMVPFGVQQHAQELTNL